MMNPPYSQGTKSDPSQYELSFVEHLLDSLTEGARAAVIVPQSSMTGKTKDEQTFKENILKHHTLEGVITCNTDTFYGVGTNPVIAYWFHPLLITKITLSYSSPLTPCSVEYCASGCKKSFTAINCA